MPYPEIQVYLPASLAGSGALSYLSTNGLRAQYEWRYPLRGRIFDQHRVDFAALARPRNSSDVLIEQRVPEWFITCESWARFLMIGTWEMTSGAMFKMKWQVHVNIDSGRMVRVEPNPAHIEMLLDSATDMVSHLPEGSLAYDPIDVARSTCVTFANSSPMQMTECFEKYLSLVNSTTAPGEPFLELVRHIDRPASYPGSVWHALVSDYLRQDYQ